MKRSFMNTITLDIKLSLVSLFSQKELEVSTDETKFKNHLSLWPT